MKIILPYVLCIIHAIAGDLVILKKTDGRPETCVSNEAQHVVPIYDLLTFKGSSKSVKWTDRWDIDGAKTIEGSYFNIIDISREWDDIPQIVSNGTIEGYQRIYHLGNHISEDYLQLPVQASSLSILLTSQNNWVGKNGFVIELDKVLLDGTFQSSIRSCINLDTVNERCKIISSKNAQMLHGGRKWVFLLFKIQLNNCKSRMSIEGGYFPLEFNPEDFTECAKSNSGDWLQVYVAIKSTEPGIFKIPKRPYLQMNGAGPIILETAMNHSGGVLCLNLQCEKRMSTEVKLLLADTHARKVVYFIQPNISEGNSMRFLVSLDPGTYLMQFSIVTDGNISGLSVCQPVPSGTQVVEATEGRLLGCQTLPWNNSMPSKVIYTPELNEQIKLMEKGSGLGHSRSDDSGFDRIALSCFLLLISIMTFSLTLILWFNIIIPESRPTLKIKYKV